LTKIKTIWQNRSAYIKAYLWPLPKFRREVVVMVDGVHSHGGLTDRFRNILSIYAYCKRKGLPFRIYYTYPCPIEWLLIPNLYNWHINEKHISHSRWDTKEIVLYVDKTPEPHEKVLDCEISPRKPIQYHLYGNCRFAQGHYMELFNELFRPSEYLAKRIEQILQTFSEKYEAVTLRFQRLLGDFEEGDYEILPNNEKELLMQQCIQKIITLHDDGYFSTSKILVTSDSPSFLESVNQLSYVFTIPGKMEHMDFTHKKDIGINAKSFFDLFILSQAQRITLLVTGKMYCSGFPAFAAEIGGRPYHEIQF
jgi:hypothetical protein